MAIRPIYRDVLRILESIRPGQPVWPRFAQYVYLPHQAYFDGLMDTYGLDLLGPGGLPQTVEQMAPRLRQSLAPAPDYGLEDHAQRLLTAVTPLLPTPPPDLYLATLFFAGPAATLAVNRRPVIALGMERFRPYPSREQPKYWYRPAEIQEMIPHEAAHAARMTVLQLPPTPRALSLLDMVMLEGTALTFTDMLLGRPTLATFMPREHLAWHQANDRWVRAAVVPDLFTVGMDTFRKYFSQSAPISGYYVGYSLCREYLERFGLARIAELLTLPSLEILRRLGAPL